jgi:hypothetical protein
VWFVDAFTSVRVRHLSLRGKLTCLRSFLGMHLLSRPLLILSG